MEKKEVFTLNFLFPKKNTSQGFFVVKLVFIFSLFFSLKKKFAFRLKLKRFLKVENNSIIMNCAQVISNKNSKTHTHTTTFFWQL